VRSNVPPGAYDHAASCTSGRPSGPFGNTERLCLTHRLLPLLVGSLNSAPQHHPFAPSLCRGLPRYYEWFRPCAPLPYSRPYGSSTWASPFASVLQVPPFRPTASDRLRPPSCRVPLRPYTGAAGADPTVTTPRGFDTVPTLSTRHQWFPCGPLPVSYLTWFSPGLFLLRSPPWLLTTAAGGGLEPAPASRFRGASPHRLYSCALQQPFRLSSCSWRTVICVADVEEISFSLFSPFGFMPRREVQVIGFHIPIELVKVYVGQKWGYYTSYKVANFLVEFSTSILRTQLRPSYGDGFLGAPLQTAPPSQSPMPQE
jgi:hypothetical protein